MMLKSTMESTILRPGAAETMRPAPKRLPQKARTTPEKLHCPRALPKQVGQARVKAVAFKKRRGRRRQAQQEQRRRQEPSRRPGDRGGTKQERSGRRRAREGRKERKRRQGKAPWKRQEARRRKEAGRPSRGARSGQASSFWHPEASES